MRTLARHGIFAVAAATLAIACAEPQRPASDPSPQAAFNDPKVQPVNDPVATNHNPPQKPFNDPKPQESQFAPHSAQQPISDPSPQKPFNGPGSDSDRAAKNDRPLSDNEIVGVVMTANDGEVQMAEVAVKKATANDVKQFAGMMKSHHSTALQKDKALVKKAKLTNADSDVSTSLKSDVESTTKDLRSKDAGKEFDRAYMDSQVKAHKDVLTIIDNRLIPNAQNGELKSSLTEMRRTVADHLVKAESIQKKLDGATSSLDGDKATGSGKASVKARTTGDTNVSERR